MSVPDSLPWMESVDVKMDRAKEHLDTLYAEAGVFFKFRKHEAKLYPENRRPCGLDCALQRGFDASDPNGRAPC
jgi:hypothetical protein